MGRARSAHTQKSASKSSISEWAWAWLWQLIWQLELELLGIQSNIQKKSIYLPSRRHLQHPLHSWGQPQHFFLKINHNNYIRHLKQNILTLLFPLFSLGSLYRLREQPHHQLCRKWGLLVTFFSFTKSHRDPDPLGFEVYVIAAINRYLLGSELLFQVLWLILQLFSEISSAYLFEYLFFKIP